MKRLLFVSTSLVVAAAPFVAFAQDQLTVPVQSSTGNVVMDWLVSVASAVLTAAVPVVSYFIATHLKIANTAALNALLADGASRFAGIAKMEIMAAGSKLETVTAAHPAVQKAVDSLNAAFPDAIASLGAQPEQIANIVIGELGKQLNHAPVAAASAPAAAAPAAVALNTSVKG